MNEDLKTLRRKEDNLFISGTAVLLFSIWDAVRFVMSLIMNPKMLVEFVDNLGLEPDEVFVGEVVSVVMIGGILLGAVLVRLFIFLGARAESKGKKRGWIYVIVAFLVLAFIVSDQMETFFDYYTDLRIILEGGEVVTKDSSGMDTAVASILLNITSAVALIDIIVSSFMVKMLRKKLNIKSGEVR